MSSSTLSSKVITGHAGAGKTTRMLESLKEMAAQLNIQEHHVIPAISAMHGARRRLRERLRVMERELGKSGIPIKFEVETIDSFALRIANKARRLLGQDLPFVPYTPSLISKPQIGNIEINDICVKASQALQIPSVASMVGNSYPVMLVDEFQDCDGVRLEFMKQLSGLVLTIYCGDEFQDITTAQFNAPALQWVKGKFNVEALGESSHRTTNRSILNTAALLRAPSGQVKPFIKCLAVPKAAIAGAIISKYILEFGWLGRTAIISYSFKAGRFASETVAWLEKDTNSKGAKTPLYFRRIRQEEEEQRELVDSIREHHKTDQMHIDDKLSASLPLALQEAHTSAKNRARRLSETSISRTVIEEYALASLHHRRSFGPDHPKKVALSVHSAKNQEWDNVFVLWSSADFRKSHCEEYRRRILYNAITRAKKNCMVLVLGDKAKAVLADAFLAPFIEDMQTRKTAGTSNLTATPA